MSLFFCSARSSGSGFSWDLTNDTVGDNTQAYVALVAFVGVVLAQVVAVVGLAVKQSIDARTTALAASKLELDRRAQEAKETEERLTRERLSVEVALRAIEVLETSGSHTAPSPKIGGALVTLAMLLEQVELSLALLAETWSRRTISPGSAVLVVRQAWDRCPPETGYRGRAEDNAHWATALLFQNAATLGHEDGMTEWPVSHDWTQVPRQVWWSAVWVLVAVATEVVDHSRPDEEIMARLTGAATTSTNASPPDHDVSGVAVEALRDLLNLHADPSTDSDFVKFAREAVETEAARMHFDGREEWLKTQDRRLLRDLRMWRS